VNVLAPVILDGSASSDPDGHLPLTYYWTQVGGLAVILSDPTAISPTFTAPSDPAALTFTLAVTDSLGLPDPTSDEVVITVKGYHTYLPLVMHQDESSTYTAQEPTAPPFCERNKGSSPLLFLQQFPFCSRDLEIATTVLREASYAIAKSRLQLGVSSQNGNCCFSYAPYEGFEYSHANHAHCTRWQLPG
jgi:hypothetical protein